MNSGGEAEALEDVGLRTGRQLVVGGDSGEFV